MDLSSGPNIPSESPERIEITMVTYMDDQLFKAAEDGDIEPLNAYQDHLDRLVDGNQNTALHIYSSTGGYKVVKKDHRFLCFHSDTKRELSINYVYLQQLLEKCPSLLLQANDRGEIPLHVAAGGGHCAIVGFLIQRSKEQHGGDLEQMLRMRDKEQETALHKAARYGHLDVMRVLLKEDPDLLSFVNTNGETPLYMVALTRNRAGRRNRHSLVDEMLEYCKSMPDLMPCLIGPCGRTILHAAVFDNNREMVRTILERTKDDLTEKRDEDGRTPLHYAACFGRVSIVRMLLECNGRTAYITDKERGMTPLHMAAWKGKIETMTLIISHYPGCSGVVDQKGWNFLHFALFTLPRSRFDTYKFSSMCENMNSTRIGYLLDQKDADGITPSHVLDYGKDISLTEKLDIKTYFLICRKLQLNPMFAMTDCYKDSREVKEKIKEAIKEISSIKLADKPTYSIDWAIVHSETYKERRRKLIEKVSGNHLLVSTLVATVTFAAAFTVPGGYKSEEGTAILSRNSAFQAFVITDSLSFIFSLSAILFHFFMVPPFFREAKPFKTHNLLVGAYYLTLASFFTMVIAFSTGVYAVLESSAGLAISACSLTVIIFCASLGYWSSGYFIFRVIS